MSSTYNPNEHKALADYVRAQYNVDPAFTDSQILDAWNEVQAMSYRHAENFTDMKRMRREDLHFILTAMDIGV